MSPFIKRFFGLNWVIVITMAGLVAFGLFAVYSATWMRTDPDLVAKFPKQVRWVGMGVLVFFATSLIDYRWIRWLAVPTYIAGMVFLILVRSRGMVKSGASSWISIGPIDFQPSQVAIIGSIMMLAVVLGELQRLHPVFRNHMLRLILSITLVSVPFLLIASEPDLGSASVLGPVAVCMLLVANIPFRYITTIGLLALIAMPYVYWFALKDYQRSRITSFLEELSGKEGDLQGDRYTTRWVVTAIGSAGWEGKGHKGSRIKMIDSDKKTFNELGFIAPTVIINDYIFSVIGEEQGFRGSMIMITAFLLLLLQCLFVAFYSRDQMGRLIVVGAVTLLFVHIFMNVGMSIQLVPITGLPLPFVSYGGTFMLICMFLLGLVESVWVHRKDGVPEAADKSLFY